MNSLDILRHDESLIWVDKPSGLLSVPGLGSENQDCVVRRAAVEFDWVREVHRLDQATSGVMLLALNPSAHREMMRQFRERETGKGYEAIVFGVVEADEGLIDEPIRADIDDRPRQIVDYEYGKSAQTLYEVVKRYDNGTTRLALTPLTGRTHQLRLHLATIGHPILGDDLYAPEDVAAMVSRLLLHAAWLEVMHPDTNQEIRVEALYPF